MERAGDDPGDDRVSGKVSVCPSVSTVVAGARATRELCAGLPEWGIVMVSNSMPPRDLDSFVPAGTRLGFAGNRGAAGIDGITSTALGIATHVDGALPVVVFTGDLALLHDIGGGMFA